MLKRLTRFTTMLCAAFLICFLLSPTALAAGSNSNCYNYNYPSYQGVKQTFTQNVGSCKNNSLGYVYGTQTKEYKLTEASPIPVNNSCKQTTVTNSNSSYCPPASSNSGNCAKVTTILPPASCQQTTAVKPAQTTTPAQPPANAKPNNTANASVSNYAEEVVRLVNVERANNNLPALSLDTQLAAAALIRAQEATVKFSHTRPNGSSCFSVLSSMGISYRRAGENIAIGQSTPAQVVKAWMESPGHRANILGDFTKIGVGVQQASGGFNGYSWAQFFTK